MTKRKSLFATRSKRQRPAEQTPSYVWSRRHHILFVLEDVIELLAGAREANFEYEFEVRLFQFQTWILFSDEDPHPKWAGSIAGIKVLDWMEEKHFADEEGGRLAARGDPPSIDLSDKPDQTLEVIERLWREDQAYRNIYNSTIGKPGGLLGLLTTPSPKSFDNDIKQRFEQSRIAADLVEFRIRAVQHGLGKAAKLNRKDPGQNRAMFFYWWPTRKIRGTRGKTAPTNPPQRER